MQITFPSTTTTISDVACLGDNHFHVRPLLTHSGSQWFHWCGYIEGLADGEQATIDLEWPRVPRAEDFPGASHEFIFRHTKQGSFVHALPSMVGVTEDMESWSFPSARVHGDVCTINVRGRGRPFYLTTQFPYTPVHLAKLLTFAADREPGCVQQIGRSRAGLPIQAVVLPSPNPAAQAIYLQAYQHMTEFTGPWVLDRMIRHLLSPAAQSLRERFTLHFVPVVEMDCLTYGLAWSKALKPSLGDDAPLVARKNINRDWDEKQMEAVRAVDGLLRAQLQRGVQYVAGFDLHNGWIEASNSGACYTAFPDTIGTTRQRQEQLRFIDHLYNHTNHEPPGRYWYSDSPGLFSKYFFALTGAHLSHTVEFSRSIWWNRANQVWDPYRPEHHNQFAREMLHALAAWQFESSSATNLQGVKR